jgi:hypothetical protein
MSDCNLIFERLTNKKLLEYISNGLTLDEISNMHLISRIALQKIINKIKEYGKCYFCNEIADFKLRDKENNSAIWQCGDCANKEIKTTDEDRLFATLSGTSNLHDAQIYTTSYFADEFDFCKRVSKHFKEKFSHIPVKRFNRSSFSFTKKFRKIKKMSLNKYRRTKQKKGTPYFYLEMRNNNEQTEKNNSRK